MKEVVLTGLRTNGEYHLGNYIGALLPILRLLERAELRGKCQINLFAPDLHSFTTPIDHAELYRQTMENLRLFVAAGLPLNERDVNLYRQSRIPAHSELTWILSNFSSFGELGRMVEFKEKAVALGQRERVSVGLFAYPILMAADILLYDAKYVPTGEEQRQHFEFCRRLARSFNQRFGEGIFTVPESVTRQQAFFGRNEAPRIRNLRRPQQKMSKSVEDAAGTIMLLEDPATATEKIMAATTDNLSEINFNWRDQPGVTNLLTILAALDGRPQEEINRQWCGWNDYKALKVAVAEAVAGLLERLRTNFSEVPAEALEDHLKSKEKKLAIIAAEKLLKVQTAIGLRE